MNNELKPHVKCGGGKVIILRTGGSVWAFPMYFAVCTKCKKGVSGTFASEQEAIENWNRRADNA